MDASTSSVVPRRRPRLRGAGRRQVLEEPGLVERVVRDSLTEDIGRIVIDSSGVVSWRFFSAKADFEFVDGVGCREVGHKAGQFAARQQAFDVAVQREAQRITNITDIPENLDSVITAM